MALKGQFEGEPEQTRIFLNFRALIFDALDIWGINDANRSHPPISVTEYTPKGQNDVPLLVFFTFLIRQGVLHHQQRAIKVSLA